MRDLAQITRALSTRWQFTGSRLPAVALISVVVGGVALMSSMRRRLVGQVRRRTEVATRIPADEHLADALAATAKQGG